MREDGDLGGAQPTRDAGGVERGGAVADDADRAGEAVLLAGADLGEEAEGVAGELGPGDAERLSFPGADAHEDGVVTAGEQTGERHVLTQLDLAHETRARLPQRSQLLGHDGGRQPELGDAVTQHAARLRLLVVDGHAVAGLQ
jgi:hypothetical protein